MPNPTPATRAAHRSTRATTPRASRIAARGHSSSTEDHLSTEASTGRPRTDEKYHDSPMLIDLLPISRTSRPPGYPRLAPRAPTPLHLDAAYPSIPHEPRVDYPAPIPNGSVP